MNPLKPPELEDDIRALLERAAGLEATSADVRARVFARVAGHVGPPGGGGPSGPARGSSRAAPNVPRAGLLRRMLPLAASFALGAGAGAAAMRGADVRAPASRETTPRTVDLETPAPAMSVVADPVVVAPAPERTAPPAYARRRGGYEPLLVPAPATSARSAAVPGEQLARERVLLDAARGALERQDGEAVLAAADEHERMYPNGMLAQEREAMAVRALVLLDRPDEARARVQRFRARFPDSVLLPAMSAAVGERKAP
jgi:hypothetical protein